jgi:hypothetical protein
MAITQRFAPTTTGVGDYTYISSGDNAVTTIHLCNISGGTIVVDVYILKSDNSTAAANDDNKIYSTLSISANNTYVIETEKLILSTGDKIFVKAGSGGTIVVTISTIGL